MYSPSYTMARSNTPPKAAPSDDTQGPAAAPAAGAAASEAGPAPAEAGGGGGKGGGGAVGIGGGGTPGSIAVHQIHDEMRTSFMDYAMSVIIARALPDARDGLKPVHRRILYAMHESNNVHSRPYVKCARVVGEVLGKFHPHGDASVYDALVRLAQDWNMRYPLVDGQGNFGSIEGDPAAAYRYTECRLQKLAAAMLVDIDKDTVDFVPNFDDKEREPTVLPALLPNLLINGAAGIGQMTGNRIRINDHGTYVAQHSGNSAFSAADAASQADQEAPPHARPTVLPHAKWIAGRTPWRSARRQRGRGRKERSRLRAGR